MESEVLTELLQFHGKILTFEELLLMMRTENDSW